jgi:hypothetical protein
MPPRRIQVCLEIAPKKVFASALDWPGWCRAGRDEEAALEALANYADRYAPGGRAGRSHLRGQLRAGSGRAATGGVTTEFGAPEATAEAERAPVPPAAAKRLAGLVTAAWAEFDDIVAVTPEELRKGPRGGGRDRDKMVDHVLGAEAAYARKIGVKLKQPAIDDIAAIEELRQSIAAVLGTRSDGTPPVERGWTTRYAARASRGTCSTTPGRCRTEPTSRYGWRRAARRAGVACPSRRTPPRPRRSGRPRSGRSRSR